MNDMLRPSGQTALDSVVSPRLFLHCAIFLGERRILSDESFRLVRFEGQESTSEPFEYQLELHANTAYRGTPLLFDDVIGRPVTVGIETPSRLEPHTPVVLFSRAIRGAGAGPDLSLFNGIVTAFAMEIQGVYRLTMKPRLHLLSLTNHYRIHVQCNIRDVIISLLGEYGMLPSMAGVSGDDNPAIARIQDWLQAGESNLELLHRLMAKAHLYYYFVHSGNSHNIVFANCPAYLPVYSDGRALRYTSTLTDELGRVQNDVILRYNYQRSLVSSAVHGVQTRQDEAWQADAVPTFASFQAASKPDLGQVPFRQYRIYQYGGSSDEIRHYTDATSAALDSSACVFSGASTCAQFRVGHQFSITGKFMADFPPRPVRPGLEGQSFVLTQVKHEASADGHYQNEFQATEASGFIAPFSLQETQQGTLLARVKARTGDPAPQNPNHYTPDYFDPESNDLIDRMAAPSVLSARGVFVLFSTDDEDAVPVWIKLAPHMQTVPEIGVTVVVSRAQDESELPEIQSIVQANGSLVVTPSTWTANTHVGSSWSTTYGDGKSIRFGRYSRADLAAAVAIVDTPYAGKRYRETSYSQGASYSFSCADSDAAACAPDTGELFGSAAIAADLLSASESFGSTYSRQYASVTRNYSNVGASTSTSIVGDSRSTSTINGISDSVTTHNGKITSVTTINADSDNQTTQTGASVTANTNNGDTTSTTTVTGSSTSTSTYGGTMTSTTTHNAALDSTTDHYGDVTSTTTHHSPADVTSTTTINGDSTSSTTTTGTSENTTHAGVSKSNDTVGRSNRNSATGLAVNFSVTGISTDTSATVASAQISAVGVSTSMSVRGATLDLSYTGKVTKVSIETVLNSVDLANSSVTVVTPLSTVTYSTAEVSLIAAIKMIM